MEIERIQAFECPVCLESVVTDPMIHGGCGNTFDRQCVIKIVEDHGRCPICRAEVTMDQFHPNAALRDGVREMQDQVTQEKKGVKVLASPLQGPAFTPSVERKSGKAFKKVMDELKGKDPELYKGHINKESTQKLCVDQTSGYVAVYKSGNWHFYKIGNGRGAELCKAKHFDQGVNAIFPKQC